MLKSENNHGKSDICKGDVRLLFLVLSIVVMIYTDTEGYDS